MKLSGPNAKAVADAMAKTRDGAGLGFREYLEYWAGRDPKAAIKNTRGRRPGLTDQELEWNVRFGWISDWPNGWYLRGVARRLATGDLGEFALFLQMHVRQAALNPSDPDDRYTEVWPLLHALAIRDRTAVDALAREGAYPLRSGHPDSVRIYNGTHALLRSGPDEAARLPARRADRKTPEWLGGILACLDGIAAGDATRVAEGIERHLAGFRKATRINPLERIISLEAHGLYRLAEQIRPDLVAGIDTRRGLPWDRDFHDWTAEHRPAMTVADFGNCPEPIASAFVTLQRPSWCD